MKIVDYKVINEKFKTKKDLLAEDKRFLLELNEIADEINSGAAERPIVLLSGPSGSGKTTTAALLHKLLEKYGRKSRVISLDNYFKAYRSRNLRKSISNRLREWTRNFCPSISRKLPLAKK